VIGTGLASFQDYEVGDVAPVPTSLSKIIMTDSNKNILEECIDNIDAARFPASNVQVGQLDWEKRVQNGWRNHFDFITGCDCLNSSPMVNPLANIISHSLKGLLEDDKQVEKGSFLHVGPSQRRNSVEDLKFVLAREHGMDTKMTDIVLECIDLEPLVMDSLGEADTQMKMEMEDGIDSSIGYETKTKRKLKMRYN